MDTETRTAQVGDLVLHHGHLHEIKALERRAVMDENDEPTVQILAVFENGEPQERDPETGAITKRGTGFVVKADAGELVWSDELQAWYLPGRILTNDERTVVEALTGTWPTAEAHPAMVRFLDVQGPLDQVVDPAKVARVVRARRMAQIGGRQEGESDEALEARVTDYARRAIAHAEVHRLERAERAKGSN